MKNNLIILFFSLLIFFNFNILYSQTPDTSPPDIYNEVIPGLKNDNQATKEENKEDLEKNKSEEKEQKEKDIKDQETEIKKSFSFKELFQNKTIVNLIILIVIFIIFFIYRLRR
ncbi:MAG: hypothetical protein KatS3mg129_1139 [Leptospiraceae bacterium]|nr:MAG: hypothetical protein KatS3mg129_1139 [Leptospiraceae bacterium]